MDDSAQALDDTALPPSSSSSPMYTARVSRTCVYPPTIIRIRDPDSSAPSSLLQFSLHTAPLTVKRELHSVLPTLNPSDSLLILPTFQHSHTPLTAFTAQTEAEKNRLLETFSGFARQLCLHLTSRGYFADYIDPCTGHPALTRSGGTVYSEVDGATALLRYRVEQAGSCSIVLHPLWGSGCYPASCVTNARVEAVLEGLERVRRRWEVKEEKKEEEERKEDTNDVRHGISSSACVSDSRSEITSDRAGEQQQQQEQQSSKEMEEEKESVQHGDMQRIITLPPVAADT